MIAIQLYVWMCTSLSKRIDELFISSSNQELRLAVVEYEKLDPSTESSGQNPSRVAADINSFEAEVERLRSEVKLLDKVAVVFIFPRALKADDEPSPAAKAAGELSAAKVTLRQRFEGASRALTAVRLMALRVQEKASLIVGILASFVLPLLFGTIGALAYVIRAISDQIKRSTFAQSSPIRHQMCVALGALAGVVIGLFNTGLTTQVNLSPLALAFLAGLWRGSGLFVFRRAG